MNMVPPKRRFVPQGVRSKKTTLGVYTEIQHGISSRIQLRQDEMHESHSCRRNSETVPGPAGVPCYEDV